MRLLLTRPLQDSQHLASILKKRGHESVLSPLLEISYLGEYGVRDKDIQAIISTSRHALIAMSKTPDFEFFLDQRVFVVGQSTRDVAIKLGFKNIFQGSGGASDMVRVIDENCQPDHGELFYPRGSHISFNLEKELELLGFSVFSPIVYHSTTINLLSDKVWEELKVGNLDGVLLLSPRTAQVFSDLILQNKSANYVRKLDYFCLSLQVVDNIAIPNLKKVYTPSSPTLGELLNLIDKTDVDFQ